jgi:hypothetical protein
MSQFRVDFNSLEWASTRPGARFKLHRVGTRQIRLIEFLSGDVVPYPCEEGHAGLVLAGGLDIDIGGKVVSFGEGDGIVIPAGSATAHRATRIIPGTRLLFVEDVCEG